MEELEASLVFMDNVPGGSQVPNSDIVTVLIKVLSGRAVLDGVTISVIAHDEPLKNNRLVNTKVPKKQLRCDDVRIAEEFRIPSRQRLRRTAT